MKLTKEQAKNHQKCQDILSQDRLSYDDKLFVLEYFHEGANNVNSSAGAFFTPYGLARDFGLEIWNKRKIIDLCAGIGMLSFVAFHEYAVMDITCLEVNPEYLAVGKKILPEANWVLGSVTDKKLIESLGHFGQAISNPPFGNIKADSPEKGWLKYTSANFEYKVIEIASKIADKGIFILPQESTPFKYSGQTYMKENNSNKYEQFKSKTGLTFEFNVGIDTGVYRNEWKGVSPMCEIINVHFDGEDCF